MRRPKNEVERMALAWWQMHKPANMTEAEHRKNPQINTTTPVEAALAVAVAVELK